MTIRLGVVMDPIQTVNYHKDSTLAMLWEAQDRGFELYYFEQVDLFSLDGIPYGMGRKLTVNRDASSWFTLQTSTQMPLVEFNVILMRKDPPFNEEYIYTTYLLEQAEKQGVLVVNRAQALRDCNEKFFATHFPECSPPTLVTQSIEKLQAFWHEHEEIVCKPLNNMGGTLVFRLTHDDKNANAIFNLLTQNQTVFAMAQKFIPEIKAGDKRILLINGEAVPHALARVPQGNDWRGNLALGAKGVIQPLSEKDRFICAQIGPELKKRGLYFVGIDVIGDYLTEINVTSPTGIRQIDEGAKINVSSLLMDFIENNL